MRKILTSLWAIALSTPILYAETFDEDRVQAQLQGTKIQVWLEPSTDFYIGEILMVSASNVLGQAAMYEFSVPDSGLEDGKEYCYWLKGVFRATGAKAYQKTLKVVFKKGNVITVRFKESREGARSEIRPDNGYPAWGPRRNSGTYYVPSGLGSWGTGGWNDDYIEVDKNTAYGYPSWGPGGYPSWGPGGYPSWGPGGYPSWGPGGYPSWGR